MRSKIRAGVEQDELAVWVSWPARIRTLIRFSNAGIFSSPQMVNVPGPVHPGFQDPAAFPSRRLFTQCVASAAL